MSARVAMVGTGMHGSRIAAALLDRGFQLTGAADPAFAGQPIAAVVDHPRAPQSAVVADSAELLISDPPELVILTAPVNLEALGELSLPFLDAGIDVLTIHPDAFDPPDDWSARIDARGRAGGASFLSTGVQDVWWVHVPAVAAAATSALTRVEIAHATDLDTLSLGLGQLFGVGQPVSEFARIRDEVFLVEASVLGGPMRVLAKRLGLTPGEPQRVLEPITAEDPIAWTTAGIDVAPGLMTGFKDTVRVDTEEGVAFHGVMRTALLEPGELPSDRVVLHGDPVLTLEHSPFPGARITDIVPVARIDDLRAAAPGLHTAASLPPASYRHPTKTR